MTQEVTFVIDSDGRTLFLVSECMEGSSLLEYAKIARASHVEPATLFKRLTFHILRRIFGEYGKVGNWTRTWKCLWRVRIVNGPILRWNDVPYKFTDVMLVNRTGILVWDDRKEAIAAEIEYLNQRFIGEKHD
jgi:hypothetical protein